MWVIEEKVKQINNTIDITKSQTFNQKASVHVGGGIMKVHCFHCYRPLGQSSFKFFHDAYKGELVEGGRKVFCNEKCYDKYLQKYFVEEYGGNKIYWVLKGRQKYYIPYAGCSYGFKTIEDCKKRMDSKNIAII